MAITYLASGLAVNPCIYFKKTSYEKIFVFAGYAFSKLHFRIYADFVSS